MARIRFLWIQELPPNQTGQEETVNSHGHHLGRMPRDTPGQHEFPASPFSSTPHSSKARLCSLWKALDSVLTGFLQDDAFPCRKLQKFPFPFSFYLRCVLSLEWYLCRCHRPVAAASTWHPGWAGSCLMAQSMLAGCFKSGKGTLALLFAPSFLLLMLSFY